MRRLKTSLLLVTALLTKPVYAIDHSVFDRLLKAYVKNGQVNYHGFQKDSAAFKSYLQEIANAQPDSLPSKEAKLAFWINAYNACVIKGVLDHYPLRSVLDVKGFFDKIVYSVANQSFTLNEIEKKTRSFSDPRVHFALVCASSSCPILRSEVYVPDRLDNQLLDQARHFLANPDRGMRLLPDSGVAELSQIFKWYGADFTGENGLLASLRGSDKVLKVLIPYMDESSRRTVENRSLTVKYKLYDWTLNEQH